VVGSASARPAYPWRDGAAVGDAAGSGMASGSGAAAASWPEVRGLDPSSETAVE